MIELPRDLGLADDTYASAGTAGDIPGGWDGRLDQLPDWPGCEFRGIPRRRLRFRRAFVGIGMPTEATDRAFGDLKRLRGFTRLRHAMGLRRLSRRGLKEWKTVCQMTKWYSGEEFDEVLRKSTDESETPLERGFSELLADLDLWLQAYGLVSGEIEIGSIALHDLPPAVPWTIHIKDSPDAPGFTFTGLLPVHDRVPDVVSRRANQDAAKEAAILVATGAEVVPAFNAFSLLFQSQANALAGRRRQAAIEAGTAVEALVVLVIKESLKSRNTPRAAVDRILNQRWTTLYNRQLLHELGVPTGRAESEHSKWWRVHYPQRSAAVHEGVAPSRIAALEMVSDTWDLFDWIGQKSRSCPHLASFGESIRVMRHPTE